MSEPKCKLCEEPLPTRALHFSNEAAIQNGYCSWFCMISDLGQEAAMKVLEKRPESNSKGQMQSNTEE